MRRRRRACGVALPRRHRRADATFGDRLGVPAPLPRAAAADAYVFSRRAFAPSWMPPELVHEIAPSIDPFAPKNQELTADEAAAILDLGRAARRRPPQRHATCGPTAPGGASTTAPTSSGPDRRPAPDVPLVVQVSRWDRLKDMAGVMDGFADFVVGDHGSQLVLAGPAVSAVSRRPGGGEPCSRDCWERWRRLPPRRPLAHRHLLPADGRRRGERRSSSTPCSATPRWSCRRAWPKGFGLTVAEAMFKGRPVVASAVGGIQDQIVDGESGLLLPDPTDLAAFSRRCRHRSRRATTSRDRRARQERVIDRFLPDRQLQAWCAVLRGGSRRSLTGRSTLPDPPPT